MKNSKFSGLNFDSLEKLSKDEQKKIVGGYGGSGGGGGTCGLCISFSGNIYACLHTGTSYTACVCPTGNQNNACG